MTAFRQPEFLTDNDRPVHRIRCPIHGFIHFSENELKLIDHYLVGRLRYVRQLALTELVYPGATHTRFAHSLGVMEIATRSFDAIAVKHGDKMERVFKSVNDFDRPMAKARQVLRVAALLHDVGHASFSHAAEKVVNSGIGHEELTCLIMRNASFLRPVLEKHYGSGFADWAAAVVKGDESLPPQMQILHDLISGEMDADRTDYLIRDSHHCGVEYGRFDYRRMTECLELIEDDLGGLQIALNRDGIHTLEALILARYQMNTQVYHHRLRRIYDHYLVEYHKALGTEVPDSPEKVTKHNDVTMMSMIMADAHNGLGARREWAERIVSRKHHRQVHETGVDANAKDILQSKQLFEKLRQKFDRTHFVFDIAKVGIHRFLTRDDQDEAEFVDLKLVDRRGRKDGAGFVSQVLGKIPKDFQCARIYADVDRNDGIREEITEFADKAWREERE